MSDLQCRERSLHAQHPWQSLNGLEYCPGVEFATPEDDILADLKQAESENNQRLSVTRVGCAVCNALSTMSDPVKAAVQAALDGTIGRDKLVTILTRHGYDVGRRAVERHRQEGHS